MNVQSDIIPLAYAGPTVKAIADETLLWSGKPGQGFLFHVTDFLLVPLSLAWCVFSIYWTLSLLTDPGDLGLARLIFAMFGLGMVGLGLYLLGGRFLYDRARRAHTIYAVTSKRIIIAQDWPTERIKSLTIPGLPDIRLFEGFGDVGTIRFCGGEEIMFYLMGGNESWPWAASAAPPSFEKIRDAHTVYALILKQKQDSSCNASNPEQNKRSS